MYAGAARQRVRKAFDLKANARRGGVAVAKRPAVRYLWCEFNANASKFLDCFLQASRFPYFYRCVVNRATHFIRLRQSQQRLSNVLDVYQRKHRAWREWNTDPFPLRTCFKNLRTPRRRGLLNTWPDDPGNA